MNGIFHNLISIEGQNFIESVNVLGHIGAGNSAVFLVEDVKSGETFAMKVCYESFNFLGDYNQRWFVVLTSEEGNQFIE